MTSTAVRASLGEAVAALRVAVDEALSAELGVVADDGLLDALREMEVQRRRLAAVDARLVSEVDARGLAHERGARSTAVLLGAMLRVSPAEAKARVIAAQNFSSRSTVSGERLEAALPAVAEALARGEIGSAHAAIIARTIDALPMDVQADRDREIEAQLVVEARRFAPSQLGVLGRRLVYLYDQDGTLADDADRARRCALDYRRHADGSLSGQFRLDPTTAEAFETVLDAKLAATSADERSRRTPTQLRHDALRDLLFALLRTGQLAATAAVTTTVIVTATLQQWAAAQALAGITITHEDTAGGREPGPPGAGPAVTAHGALLTPSELAPLLGDAQILPVVLSGLEPIRRIEAYGDKHRIFTANQRLAMAARDHGCTFPGCTSTPSYCEAHHITDHADGGPTTVANGALVCAYHQRNFTDLGYRCLMLNGTPHWIPPPWIDPTQTPRRNTYFDSVRRPLP